MPKAKSDKVITLLTQEDDLVETLLAMEPGPIYVQPAETPDGTGVYVCAEPFTQEEADAQFNVEEEQDDFPDEIPLDSLDENEF